MHLLQNSPNLKQINLDGCAIYDLEQSWQADNVLAKTELNFRASFAITFNPFVLNTCETIELPENRSIT